jgi:hypothetical protein
MTDQQRAELPPPCVGAFDDPAAYVAPQFSAILIASNLIVLSVGRDQFDATSLPTLSQRVGVVTAIRDHSFRFLPRPAHGPRDTDLLERGVRKRSFSRRGAFQPNSQWNALTVSQYHPLRSLAALGFTDCRAPFFAGAKLPSRKASSHFSRPTASKAPSNVRQAWSQTPSSSHCFSRRQRVEGDGYSSGKNRHAAQVCRIHRMPSKHSRLDAHGRLRWSLLRHGSGHNDSTSSHCSSANNFCRFFMIAAQQFTRLARK